MFNTKILSHYIYKYKLKDPWDVVNLFEKEISEFSGSKYGVSVDCCSHAIFLSLKLVN